MRRREPSLRHHLAPYLTGDLSLDDFAAWLDGARRSIGASGDAAARELAHAIELALSEHAGGRLTLAELRAELETLVQHAHPHLRPVVRAS